MSKSASRGSIMEAVTQTRRVTERSTHAGVEFDLLPKILTRQCRSLIESYHEVHGFASLPNMLWQFRMGPLIERHLELRHLLRKASTTRSAKKANDGFVQIATTISRWRSWQAALPAGARSIRSQAKRRATSCSGTPMDRICR
jgi:hypothetical protein